MANPNSSSIWLFFHITIEASDFFSPYSSRYVFLYGTHGESCQYGLCSLPICNPPQPQISHPTLLPYQGPWKYRWNILVNLILKLVSTLNYMLEVLNPTNAPDFFRDFFPSSRIFLFFPILAKNSWLVFSKIDFWTKNRLVRVVWLGFYVLWAHFGVREMKV